MTARDLLNLNGDFRESPLLETARRLHAALTSWGLPYAVVGGLAVLRHGAARTTRDVDLLVRAGDLERAREALAAGFKAAADHVVDRANGVEVDILVSGEGWGMVIPLPDPARVAEYEPELGACFPGLLAILELKTAVYLEKKKADGPEVAAKDLADVVALLRANRERLPEDAFDPLHPVLRRELRRIRRRVERARPARR